MNTKKLNIENKKIWNIFMKKKGNNCHKKLIATEIERLSSLKKDDKRLDMGCENGLFARRMAIIEFTCSTH